MSTGATIARQTEGNDFVGRYVHSDGYPSGVGLGVLRALSFFGLTEGKKVLLDDHPAGWSNIVSCDWMQEIGFVGSLGSTDQDRPQCFCHGDRSEEEWTIDSTGDEGGVAWAYVFSNSNNSLMVYERTYEGGPTWELQRDIDLTNLSEAMSEMMKTCSINGVLA